MRWPAPQRGGMSGSTPLHPQRVRRRGVTPAWSHALDQLPGCGVERHFARGLGHDGSRIVALAQGLAAGLGQLPRILERHIAD